MCDSLSSEEKKRRLLGLRRFHTHRQAADGLLLGMRESKRAREREERARGASECHLTAPLSRCVYASERAREPRY